MNDNHDDEGGKDIGCDEYGGGKEQQWLIVTDYGHNHCDESDENYDASNLLSNMLSQKFTKNWQYTPQNWIMATISGPNRNNLNNQIFQ